MALSKPPSPDHPQSPQACPDTIQTVPKRVRHDPPLQHKVSLLLTLAGVGGFGLGAYSQIQQGLFWHLAGALVVGLGLLWWHADRWVTKPYARLADQAQRLSRTGLTSSLKRLPIGRGDEIGRIAKSLHSMGVASMRHHMEVRSLRRTLDHRVADATRKATTELSRLVMRDALTDLGNRRFLDDQSERVFNSAKDSGTDLSCIVMDLDHFKHVNDTLGHAAGDHLLVFLAGLIRATCRHDDLAIRLGGDEFVVLMPGADTRRAGRVANMIRKLFTRQAYTMFPNTRMLDLSFGIASLHEDPCHDTRALIQIADRRLYEDKQTSER